MSGIVGSYFNTRGSGVVAKLGTDGQIFTSTGLGLSQGFEAAAGGGKILQAVYDDDDTERTTTSSTYVNVSGMPTVNITPAATSSKILIIANCGSIESYDTGVSVCSLFRDSTNLGTTDGGFAHAEIQSYDVYPVGTISVLDSPSSTSQITYQIRIKNTGGTLMYFSRTPASKTSICAIEIGA